jgi:hypothetical protein
MLPLAVLSLAVVLGVFIIPLLFTWHDPNHPRDAFASPHYVAPRVIQNSCIAYAIGWATFGPSFAWGVNGDFWPAIVRAGFFGLGLLVVYVLRGPIFGFLASALGSDSSITVHEFIARTHGDDPWIRAFAAALTVFAMSGLIICEMLGIRTMLKPLLAASVELTDLFIAVILLVVISFTLVAGHFGVMHSTQLQLGVLYFGLFGATAFLFYLQISQLGHIPPQGTFALALSAVLCAVMYSYRRVRYVDISPIQSSFRKKAVTPNRKALGFLLLNRFQKILNSLVGIFTILVIALIAIALFTEGLPMVVHDSVAALQIGTNVSKMTLISLILLALCHPLVDLVNWQRLAAFERNRHWSYVGESQWVAAFRSFCATYAVEVSLVGLFISLFGAVAGSTLTAPLQKDAVSTFVAHLLEQQNVVASVALAFLLLSALAIVVSTTASLFCAILCAVHYDMRPMFRSERKHANARADDGQSIRCNLVTVAGIGLAIFAACHFAGSNFKIANANGDFLGLVFAFSSVQLSLVPLLLGPLVTGLGGIGTVSSRWALVTMAVSGAVSIATITAYFATGRSLFLSFAIPGCLTSGGLLLLIGRLWFRRAGIN